MSKVEMPPLNPAHCPACGRELEHAPRKVERLGGLKVTVAAFHKDDRTPRCA